MILDMIQYNKQNWPTEGRHILASFDADSIVVYQAYRPEIAQFAVEKQYFGGEFKYSRMSWIKPNFLWMMFRSGWAAKEGQEHVLAVRIKREGFDRILQEAVHSSYQDHLYESRESWQKVGSASDVRLQWDPDHGPMGEKKERRAIQLGLRGDILRLYGREWIISITDISDFVRNQATHRGNPSRLKTPRERVYPVTDEQVIKRLGLSSWTAEMTGAKACL